MLDAAKITNTNQLEFEGFCRENITIRLEKTQKKYKK